MNRIARIFLFTAIAMASVAKAQTAVIAPPTTGLLVQYQYWPVQYVQWVGTELPYSMIELDVDTSAKQSLYNVVLTDRVTGKRIVYANADGLVAVAKAQGQDAYKTQIAFEAAETSIVGSTSTLRLSLSDGKPLQWTFVQGSDISEQGAGLTPLPQVPIPIFVYREQAAVAGEGTALQIGDKVSTAEVWSEISKPPYFVAYRGAMSLNAHTTVFAAGKETWTIASAPAELKVGQSWELEGEHGNHRTLRIVKADGMKFVIAGSDRFSGSVTFTVECTRTANDWAVERVRYAPIVDGEKHFLSMQFTAPLTSASTASNLDMMIGRKAKMASATLAFIGAPADRTVTLQMQSPAWIKGKTLVEETTTTANSMVVISKPSK